MQTSESISEISKAVSQFQAEISNPANTASNPFYKSKYAPLPDVLNLVRPILAKYGLSVIQNPYTNGDSVVITTRLMHSSGEWIETDSLNLKPEKNTPQGIGGAITYGRRYSISAVLGIASEEDDDGNTNEKKSNKNNKEETKPKIDDVKIMKSKVTDLAREKSAISDDIKTTVKSILAKYHVSGNPNKIDDINELKKLLEEINNIKVEDK